MAQQNSRKNGFLSFFMFFVFLFLFYYIAFFFGASRFLPPKYRAIYTDADFLRVTPNLKPL